MTSEGWRNLQALGIEEGMIAIAYENSQAEYSQLYQFSKYHLWSGSSAFVTCPSAMTDGAARLLSTLIAKGQVQDASRQVLQDAVERLTSRDPKYAWTSGQWMTERIGGSDVSGTETVGALLPESPKIQDIKGIDGAPLGPWSISGFKWFSSATDSNMTVLLAKTQHGISAFYAPTRRDTTNGETILNGIRIQRMKNKLGTRTVPTAELELKGMRGYLLGKEGQGTKEISAVLNITRVHNAVGGMGFWARGLAIARAFARVRKSGGKLLTQTPAHVRTLAKEHIEYRANMQLTFFVVMLLGISEQPSNYAHQPPHPLIPKAREDVTRLLRLLTPLMKAQTALSAIAGLRVCIECLGGIGYLENDDQTFNVARLFRDANVLSIWEGTTNIQADDLVRVLKGRDGENVLSTLNGWMETGANLGGDPLREERGTLFRTWVLWRDTIEKSEKEELKWDGQRIMRDLGWLVCGFLLMVDAARDGDELAVGIARRWVWKVEVTRLAAGGGSGLKQDKRTWEQEASWERRMVFDDHRPSRSKL